ncbi:MAG: dihydropteroate synthase-like protein [Candidatus Lokiarchaeota archaeon]|nr:dihydropteroate synthase-like protein [Candidatus Lokiarchaeota archaeon]
MRILILTGKQSYSILRGIAESIKIHNIEVYKLQVSISAFITPKMTEDTLNSLELTKYDLILLPGFIQWDLSKIENKYNLPIRKGPEFASDLPMILNNLGEIELSNKIAANKLFELSGEKKYSELVVERIDKAKENISHNTFFLNKQISDIIIGPSLPPPIIAEIVNCTKKSDNSILRKAQHYINSGADIIDIGCLANKSEPSRVKEIIKILRKNFDVLISIDSMDTREIFSALEEGIDMILSIDIGNYRELLDLPKDIPIVILPTNIDEGYFPKDPESRVENLFELTAKLQKNGFTKLIADPLLETPISPGILNSLQAYYLYNLKSSQNEHNHLKLPMFFGISNVVELMDIDSIGINGLLAAIAIELDMGILFTVEHSTKMMNGVRELKEAVKLNYLSKSNNTPPINQGIQYFKAKGKTSQDIPDIVDKNILKVEEIIESYIQDEKGYFKIYVNHYHRQIRVLFYSNDNIHKKTIIGIEAEAISKKIIELNLTNDIHHINYLGRELKKAEICLDSGKPYIQDE